jgi:hypothetical protein
MLAKRPTCEHCSARPATCRGKYDRMTEYAYACDECCGHGCEDGQCRPLMADDPRAYVS